MSPDGPVTKTTERTLLFNSFADRDSKPARKKLLMSHEPHIEKKKSIFDGTGKKT